MIDNGWVRIDTESGTGSTAVSATVLKKNTGRSEERSVTLVGVNAHGETATATIKQDPADLFITVDHFEDENGDTVTKFNSSYVGDCYIVGYANVDFITISEISEKEYTDMDDVHNNTTWHDGFLLTDADGAEDRIALESPISYGTDAQYMFKIAFHPYDNDTATEREIVFEVTDDGDTQATAVIKQKGIPT